MKKFLCIIIAMLGIWAILAFFYVQIPDYYQDRTGKRGEIWQNVLSKVGTVVKRIKIYNELIANVI